jgi:RNA polymerase sigma-70 factor (ECF subfamily)
MSDRDTSKTSLTLLGRLRQSPTDQHAWDTFVERYGPKVYAWCRRWRLQESDAQDVTQNVLLELARQMQSFVYQPNGTFRGWLRTVSHCAYCDFLSARQRVTPGSGEDGVLAQLNSVEAREDLLLQLEQEFDRELLDEATARVRLRVEPHTWDAFALTAVEGLSGAEAASRLGMQVGTVYVARGKVQKMLQEEVRRLETQDSDSAG